MTGSYTYNRFVRTILWFFLPALLVIAGCQPRQEKAKVHVQKSKPNVRDLDDIKESGELIVLTDNSSTSYFIHRGQPMGFEYELTEMFCDYLGVKLQVKVVNDLDEIMEMLKNGEGDIIACNFTVNAERSKEIDFSEPILLSRQVLVQRKPEYWEQMGSRELSKRLVREPIDLLGKEIHVRRGSSFRHRLENLAEEMGGPINIIYAPGHMETEELIRMVAEGRILYTVADENVSRIYAKVHPEIDVKTPLSLPQQIAWGMRKGSPDLKEEIDKWIRAMQNNTTYAYIRTKYFELPRSQSMKAYLAYSSLEDGQISPYDDIIKQYAGEVGWDWRLIASLIYQESRFDPNAESWAGAFGIMQLMPYVADEYGVTPSSPPAAHIRAGILKLKQLNEYWMDKIPDSDERMKFVLGSYNAGFGHVEDARALAEKYGKNPTLWEDHVAEYLLLKSKAKYYTDEVVKFGYCRGQEPYQYVNEILDRYKNYKEVINA